MVSLSAPTASNLNVHDRRLPAVHAAERGGRGSNNTNGVCVCMLQRMVEVLAGDDTTLL